MAAKKLSDGVVTVTWDYSRRAGLRYCDGSRKFQVAVRSYGTYDEAIADTAFLGGNFLYEEAGRRTKEYNVTTVDFNLFHRFYVKSQKDPASVYASIPTYTPLQHFGEVGEWVTMLVD